MLKQKKATLQEDMGFGGVIQIILFISILVLLAGLLAYHLFFKNYNVIS